MGGTCLTAGPPFISGTIRHYPALFRHFPALSGTFIADDIVNLSPIAIDAQIHFTADKFLLPQTSGFYLSLAYMFL